MRSLFLKIFLWFWVTLVVTGIALVLTFLLEPRGVPSQWHTTLQDTARYSGSIAVEEMEWYGTAAASTYIDRIHHGRACLFDLKGGVIAGTDCDSFRNLTSQASQSNSSVFGMRFGMARVAVLVQGNEGGKYIFATELPAGPRAVLGFDRFALLLHCAVALLVSSFICYLLTRYLTTPILRLREAAQQLAAGDLTTRAAAAIERRHDEIGELVCDFNAMAVRIEELVHRQRQLITDVSHELRSPLARLNVALDLGRERKGSDPAFDQMERDLELLNDMIERLLVVARLDTSSAPIPMAQVNLTRLAEQIVRNANFESHERKVAVSLTAGGQYFVQGNADLLQSAIENLVRNAIRYTEPGTSVEVELSAEPGPVASLVKLVVRDHGPGVADSELTKIFQPFYRVADARDRISGGAGLGLAIAERVIRIHGGTIRAGNAAPHGLQVEISLPQCRSNNTAQGPSSTLA
ncbi:MAG TPA: ATP-binding protein [Acidobacteriaceae bacterium]|jgi:two-component system sensor histidine kinase CpxA|nr:ATP-binding protein [Acidobacteriaceae bacterium]